MHWRMVLIDGTVTRRDRSAKSTQNVRVKKKNETEYRTKRRVIVNRMQCKQLRQKTANASVYLREGTTQWDGSACSLA